MAASRDYDTATDSSHLLGDAAAVRERADADGYLFFRNLLPADDVLAVRRDVLGVVERHGWRQPGQGPLGGRIDVDAINRVPDDAMRTDIGVSIDAYHDVQRLESVHALPHHPQLVGLFETLFGREVLVHARHILRMITPHRAMTPTPPHQDFPLIQGTSDTWTTWFPLGDCPRELGGLTVLRGSHRLGQLPITPARGAGGIAVPLCPGETDWVTDDFNAGDVLVFRSYTIHRALACRRKDEIRLSMDARYQPVDEPIEQRSLMPHCDLSWEEIYADWRDTRYQHYWQRQPITLVPYDESLKQPGRRIC